MKILKRIGLVLLVLAVIIGGGGMLLPRHTTCLRSTTINASPADISAQVTELRNWENWSPWHKLDPNMKLEYSSPSAGVGAWYSWAGNDKVGTGKLTVVGSTPDSANTLMDFGMGEPGKATFRFKPEGDATKVEWQGYFDMGAGPIGRWFGLFMDGMVGKDFESGLANLKAVSEKK